MDIKFANGGGLYFLKGVEWSWYIGNTNIGNFIILFCGTGGSEDLRKNVY